MRLLRRGGALLLVTAVLTSCADDLTPTGSEGAGPPPVVPFVTHRLDLIDADRDTFEIVLEDPGVSPCCIELWLNRLDTDTTAFEGVIHHNTKGSFRATGSYVPGINFSSSPGAWNFFVTGHDPSGTEKQAVQYYFRVRGAGRIQAEVQVVAEGARKARFEATLTRGRIGNAAAGPG